MLISSITLSGQMAGARIFIRKCLPDSTILSRISPLDLYAQKFWDLQLARLGIFVSLANGQFLGSCEKDNMEVKGNALADHDAKQTALT